MDRRPERVFVYGTLTDANRANAVLGPDAYEFAGRATLEGVRRVEGEYPTLAPDGGEDGDDEGVEGRLLAVDAPGLAALDEYEGVERGLYVRVPVSRTDGGEAWVYVGDPRRLGVADRVSWPGDAPFEASVRRYVRRRDVVVRPRE